MQYHLNDAAVQKAKEKLSCFVLVTNLDETNTAYEIVKEYKAQSHVETSFKFLKDPLFVGPIYLKKPERVEALAYVLLMALLIFGILERRAREAMKHETEPLLLQGAESYLRRSLEAIFDTGRHILAKTGGMELSAEYKSIARGLGEREVVSASLSETLVDMAGYRNRLVYLYYQIGDEELYDIIQNHIPDIREFVKQVYRYINER